MKRSASRFLSAATALALSMTTISSLGALTVSADAVSPSRNVVSGGFIRPVISYGISIGGTSVTILNRSDVLGDGKVSYDTETKTLTIKGGTYEYINNEKIDGLTINIAADTTIKNDSKEVNYGLAFNLSKPTTFTGDGKLTVNVAQMGVNVGYDATLTFKDANVDITASFGLCGPEMDQAAESLTVINSNVSIHTTGHAVTDFNGGITLTDCAIFTPKSAVIGAWGDVFESNGTTLAKEVVISNAQNYGLSIGEISVTSANKDDVTGNGKVSFDPDTKTITFNGGTYDYIYNEYVDGLIINIAADTNFKNNSESKHWGMTFDLEKSTTFKGAGKLTINAARTGIICFYDSKLTIEDANIDITAMYAIKGPEVDAASESLTVKNSNVSIHSSKCAISDFNGGITLKDCKITAPENVIIGAWGDVFEGDDSTYATNLVIEPVEKIKVDKVDISVKKPVAGNAPTFKSRTDTEGVELYTRSRSTSKLGIGRLIKTKNSVQWYDGKTALTRTDKFEAGKTYTAKLYVVPTDGYVFSDNVEITINGKKAVFGGTDIKNGGLFSVDFDAAATDGEDETPTDGEDGVKGDVNGDGAVTITDVSKVAAHIKSKKLLTEEEQKRADVNGDGKVDVTDLSKIAAHVKGKKQLV